MEYRGIFDTHAHYDDEKFDDDRYEVLDGLYEKGVSMVMDPACDLDSCRKVIDIASRYSWIYAAVGVHPHSASEDGTEDYIDKIKSFTENKKVKAIGEIGLDYYYDFSPRDKQIEVFSAQLALANDLGLPVIIHDREAHADTYELVKKYRPKGIIHCFSGSAEMAKEFVKLGMYIGFTGSVTFKNANKLLLAAKEVPEDKILLETDSPYLAPVPYRGQRCDSSLIPAIAERLAELRETEAQILIDTARKNACRIYKIEEERV